MSDRLQGIVGTVLLHGIVLLILCLVFLEKATPQEESGLPVMLGSVEASQGDGDPYMLTAVDIADDPLSATSQPEPVETSDAEAEMITQNVEETVALKEESPGRPKEKIIVKQPEKERVETPPAEKTEAQKRAEAEQAAAEKAAKQIAGAFGRGTFMTSKGTATAGEGLQGVPTGNTSDGQMTGSGGYGTFDLNGRSLGEGGLPKPIYNVQEEGRVVVTITVNPAGQVIGTSINKRTNTVNSALRKAAEDAARKARFNRVEGVNNQTGTITYYFKLR